MHDRPTRMELTGRGWLDPSYPGWVQSLLPEGQESEGVLPLGTAPYYLSPNEARQIGKAYLTAADYAEADRS